ncbi:MAG: ribose ABC transporter permease [Chloroflexi bacterium]|nr:ribose ABC transporter permease [Chloroflexota bacterium]
MSWSNITRLLRRLSVFLVLIGMALIFALATPRFLRMSNLLNVAVQTSIIAIVAIGQTYVILTGGIDLSVGSLIALTGAIAAGLATSGFGTAGGITAALLLGLLLGAGNGVLVVKGRLPPFVATLAMLAIARGLTLFYTQGRPISGLPESFIFLGSGRLLGVGVPVYVLAVVAIVAYIGLRYTRFGLHVRAVGGDEEITRLAGVPTNRVIFLVYVISGLTAAIGGVLLTGRLWSAQPQAAVGWELDAIAASVLGGTSLAGGVGGIGGTLAGAFIIGILSNGLNLLGISSYTQQVIEGAVFILAVLFDLLTKRGRTTRRRQRTLAQEPT